MKRRTSGGVSPTLTSAIRDASRRAGQRLHHVEAGRGDEHDGHLRACFQIAAVRTGRDDHVGARGAGFGDRCKRFLIAARDDAHVRAVVEFTGDVAKEVAQAADSDRPDARPHRAVGRADRLDCSHVHEDRLCARDFIYEM